MTEDAHNDESGQEDAGAQEVPPDVPQEDRDMDAAPANPAGVTRIIDELSGFGGFSYGADLQTLGAEYVTVTLTNGHQHRYDRVRIINPVMEDGEEIPALSGWVYAMRARANPDVPSVATLETADVYRKDSVESISVNHANERYVTDLYATDGDA